MKRIVLIIVVLIGLFTVYVGVTGASCSPSPTANDDNIYCTGIITTIYLDVTNGDGFGDDILRVDGTVTIIFGDTDIGNGFGDDVITTSGSVNLILGDTNLGNGYGDDTIINNGTVSLILGDANVGNGYGDDTIINNGEIVIISGGTNVGDGSGRDLIINNGTAVIIVGDTIVGNGYGNDVIINNGEVLLLAGDTIAGDGYGDDTIINYGTVGDIYGDTSAGNGYGDDVIINYGIVTGSIEAGGGNDRVRVIGPVYGIINGDTGYDVLEAVVNGCVGSIEGEHIADIVAFANANPSGDTITVHGNTYTWTNFEELRGIIEIYFCDGRNEPTDFATPLVSYCNIFGGLDIYDVAPIGENGRITEGILTMRSYRQDLVDILALAVNTGQHQLVSEDEFGNQLWALSSNELQIMGAEVNEPSKTYVFILSPGLCGI